MPADRTVLLASAVAATLAAGGAAAQDAPASAIPWLTDLLAGRSPAPPVEPRADGIVDRPIAVSPIGALSRDALGLLAGRASGLPADALRGSDPARLAELLDAAPVEGPAAMQDLVRRILLAEFEPPSASAKPGGLFIARIDALILRGALDPALALLEAAGQSDAATFERMETAALLSGMDDELCRAVRAGDAPDASLSLRVFCLGRAGDWPAAALTLDLGRAIGAIDAARGERLARFLDPELFEDLLPPEPIRPMTPLDFRLLDGVGETPPTRDLPLAYAASDLRPTMGWKRRIEAAERLFRAGALDTNHLLALYTEARASASGGVWDRVAAVQALEAALESEGKEALGAALPDAVGAMEAAGLLPALADLYGARVAERAAGCGGALEREALRLALLAPDPAAASSLQAPGDDDRLRFAQALAAGTSVRPPVDDPLAAAVASGFAPGGEPNRLDRMARDGRLAEALLQVAASLADGARSDPVAVAEGLGFLRRAGLATLARRAALELLLT